MKYETNMNFHSSYSQTKRIKIHREFSQSDAFGASNINEINNFNEMKSSIEIENKIKELKPILSRKYYVDKIGYFGSFSRNEQRKDSDIDILVSLRKPLGWEFF